MLSYIVIVLFLYNYVYIHEKFFSLYIKSAIHPILERIALSYNINLLIKFYFPSI
ncbi:hypothetical protein CBU02nite_26840 [Clostridium butyricum]|uniref:Uncharacterized protein n=1 Tax=Clostridium butyricum TaxID=1492 RepID=A0A512TQA7_CLOBU|nr:hypothetical protein CBU02nite_26840 [Clostridium butyricum]